MDLRSIVNAEDSPDARKLPALYPQSPPKEDFRPPPVAYQARATSGTPHENRLPTGPEHHEGRHPFPPPIRTSSYEPYPQSGSSAALAKQNPYPVMRREDPSRPSRSQIFKEKKLRSISVANVDQSGMHPYHDHGSASSSQGHQSFSTPLTHTPTGSSPGSAGAYSGFQRPTSSHSATPGSAQYHPSNLTQKSPQSSHSHVHQPSQPQSSQNYSSQPRTPLGPPSGRPSYNISHESPGHYSHSRTYSNGSYGVQQPVEPSSNVNKSPLAYSSRPPPPEHLLSAEARTREQSMSVSPKTRIDTLPGTHPPNRTPQYVRTPSEQMNQVRQAANAPVDMSDLNDQGIKPLTRRSTSSFAIGELLNEAPAKDRAMKIELGQSAQPSSNSKEAPRNSTTHTNPNSRQSPIPHQTATPSMSSNQNSNSVPPPHPHLGATSELDQPSSAMEGVIDTSQSQNTDADSLKTTSTHLTTDNSLQDESYPSVSSLKSQPARKRQRIEDNFVATDAPPIIEKQKTPTSKETPRAPLQTQEKQKRSRQVPRFAQSVRNLSLAADGNPVQISKGSSKGVLPTPMSGNYTTAFQSSEKPPVTQSTNSNIQTNGTHVPIPQGKIGPLGPWEPTILNIEPTEDITKVIMDWLYSEVVQKHQIGVGPAGGSANQGAVLEIEAKLGRLVDQNTNDRLRLPVISETVVSQIDPNMRISFESSMSEAQHRTINGFLNKAVQDSLRKPPTGIKERVRINYVHTYETDRFYELSQQGMLALPVAITDNVEARHKRKTTVRITNDQKTGKEIAKIVKARLADINVYSPRTLFDYRISINVEMNFQGSLQDLVEPDSKRGRKPDRNKDRMSYSHQAYRIDLTQVKPTEAAVQAEKEHELEIEMSSEEVRRQGLLAMNGQENDYDKLVKGFLDNVRVLARYCQPT